MRGNYEITHQDRIKFFHALLELCKPQVDSVDLVSTQLSICNCADLLEELGYDQGSWEINGWEGEIWATYTHTGAPKIFLSADAYCGRLDIGWTGAADDGVIDVEALKRLMKEHWGDYFPEM